MGEYDSRRAKGVSLGHLEDRKIAAELSGRII